VDRLVLRLKSSNWSCQFWGPTRESLATGYEAKSGETVATDFEGKPKKTITTSFEVKTEKNIIVVLRPNH
jgi:hypothetical protein